MNKISVSFRDKLNESRTIPVNKALISGLQNIYKKAFLKLVETYIAEELESSTGKSKKFYSELLDEVYKEFPDIQGANIPVDRKFLYSLYSRMNSPNKEERGLQVTEIPVETILKFLQSDVDNPLKAFLKDKVSIKTATSRIRKYFSERDIGSLGINIELQKTEEKKQKDEETYSGVYFHDIGMITITFEAAFFTGAILTKRDGNRTRIPPRLSAESGQKVKTIIGYLKSELEELPISIRHEVQHFYQGLFSKVFGTKGIRAGLASPSISKAAIPSDVPKKDLPHYMDPLEMVTDVQDESDKLQTYLNNFRNENSDLKNTNPELFQQLIKILIKKFVDSKLEPAEQELSKKYKLYRYVLDASELLRNIKMNDKSGKLHKYAIKILYGSVSHMLQENKTANKIRVLLR